MTSTLKIQREKWRKETWNKNLFFSIEILDFFFENLNSGKPFLNYHWVISDLIPRLLKIFENFWIFMAILVNVKNEVYNRIFGKIWIFKDSCLCLTFLALENAYALGIRL